MRRLRLREIRAKRDDMSLGEGRLRQISLLLQKLSDLNSGTWKLGFSAPRYGFPSNKAPGLSYGPLK